MQLKLGRILKSGELTFLKGVPGVPCQKECTQKNNRSPAGKESGMNSLALHQMPKESMSQPVSGVSYLPLGLHLAVSVSLPTSHFNDNKNLVHENTNQALRYLTK
jgi:hypothetical protein